MEREKTYGGVDPEIFESMRGEREERRERGGREEGEEDSRSISEREADELGDIILRAEVEGGE